MKHLVRRMVDPPVRAWRRWRRRLPWLNRIGGAELQLLFCALVVVVVMDAFVELADDVQEGETQRMDERIVQSLRRADDPATPIGPAWLPGVAIDITALGSYAVVTLMVTAVALFMLLQRRWRLLALVLAASVGGMILSSMTKQLVNRDRPDVVPHLREVSTPSFPSGHATLSAVVYLTLGAILAQVVRGRVTPLYCLVMALFITALVGLSRIYLGVHYPTDVMGGWALGLAWAMLCWSLANYLKQRGLLRQRA